MNLRKVVKRAESEANKLSLYLYRKTLSVYWL